MKALIVFVTLFAANVCFAQTSEDFCEVSDQTVSEVDELLPEVLPVEAIKIAIGGILMADTCFASKSSIEETDTLVDRLFQEVLIEGSTTKEVIQEFLAE